MKRFSTVFHGFREPGKCPSVGMSAECLERLDAMFEKAMFEGEIPVAFVLVARNGKLCMFSGT